MNLLVTNVHAQQAHATIRALRPHAARVVAAGYRTGGLFGGLPHAAWSRLVDKRYTVPSPVADWQNGVIQEDNTEREEAYIRALLKICDEEGIDVIFPSWDPDVYVLSKNKDRFAAANVLIPVPRYEVTLAALDKYRTIRAAQQCGFPCPVTHLYETEAEARKIADAMEFPLVIKPRFTSGSHGMAIARDPADLMKKLPFPSDGRYTPMIQEYIPGGQRESLQFVFDREGNAAFVFHKKRLRNFRVNQRLGTVSRSAPLPDYCEGIFGLMRSLGWWGCGGIEVLLDPRDGAWKLMEINARYPRQLWNRTEMGINEPLMAVEIARGKSFPEREPYAEDAWFVNPVEDSMLLMLQLLDRVAFLLRRTFTGRSTLDPLVTPPSIPRLAGDFFGTYRRGQRRVYDPLTRYFFQDPLVALIWWAQFATWIAGATRRIGR